MTVTRVPNKLVGSEFDPTTDTRLRVSAQFVNERAKIGPIKESLSLARFIASGNPAKLMRICHWIKSFHEKPRSGRGQGRTPRVVTERGHAATQEQRQSGAQGQTQQGHPRNSDLG